MKKLFLTLAAIVAAICVAFSIGTKQVDATNEVVGGVTNLLLKEDFYLSDVDHNLACHTNARIEPGKNYTMIATKEFFGNNYVGGSLQNNIMGVTYRHDDMSSTGSTMSWKMKWHSLGVFTFNFVASWSGYVEFYDFRCSYNDISEADLDHIVFYQGDVTMFKGFPIEVDLTGYEYYSDSNITITTDCTNPIDPNDIKAGIVAYDTTDGLISTDQITLIKDTYSTNQSVGTHMMEFAASDAAGNIKTLVVTINVVDSVGPTITTKNSILWEVRGVIPELNDLRSYFVIRDNYDGVISTDNLYGMTWLGNGHFNGYDVGNYSFTVKCDDASGNTTEETFTLSAVDTTPPVIELAHVEINLSELGSDLTSLKFSDYLVSYDDNSRYIKKVYVESNYKDDYASYVGIVPVKVTAIDGSGNIATQEGVVYIIDDIAPQFYIHGSLLQLADDTVEDSTNINARIRRSLNERGIKYDTILIIESEYFNSGDKPGIYDIKYAYSYQGNVVYEIGQIEVIETGKANQTTDNQEQNVEVENPTTEPEKQTTPEPAGKVEEEKGTNVTNVVTNNPNNSTNDNYLYFLVLIPIVLGVIIYFVYRKRNRVIR